MHIHTDVVAFSHAYLILYYPIPYMLPSIENSYVTIYTVKRLVTFVPLIKYFEMLPVK